MSYANRPYSRPVPIVDLPQPGHERGPEEIRGFLFSRAWLTADFDPTTGQQLWAHTAHPGYFSWSEAVAIEFYKFITLGGK